MRGDTEIEIEVRKNAAVHGSWDMESMTPIMRLTAYFVRSTGRPEERLRGSRAIAVHRKRDSSQDAQTAEIWIDECKRSRLSRKAEDIAIHGTRNDTKDDFNLVQVR